MARATAFVRGSAGEPCAAELVLRKRFQAGKEENEPQEAEGGSDLRDMSRKAVAQLAGLRLPVASQPEDRMLEVKER